MHPKCIEDTRSVVFKLPIQKAVQCILVAAHCVLRDGALSAPHLRNVEIWLLNVNPWCLACHAAPGNYGTTVQTKRHHLSVEQEEKANNRLKVILMEMNRMNSDVLWRLGANSLWFTDCLIWYKCNRYLLRTQTAVRWSGWLWLR